MAHKRINRSDAMAMAYVSQLLLTSVTALRQEMEADYDQDQTTQLLDLFRRRDAQPAETPKSTGPALAAYPQPSQQPTANIGAPPNSQTSPGGT